MNRGSLLLSLVTLIFAVGCAELDEPNSMGALEELDELVPYSTDCATVERQHALSGGCFEMGTMSSGLDGACVGYLCCGNEEDGVSQYVYCLTRDGYFCASKYWPNGDDDVEQCSGTPQD